jgi:hypothetical protein
MTGPLVSSSWLLEHRADDELLIVDTRFALGKPDAGRTAFEAGHLPGAVFADLERDLSAPVRADRVGGRHPIPAIEQLEGLFSVIGKDRANFPLEIHCACSKPTAARDNTSQLKHISSVDFMPVRLARTSSRRAGHLKKLASRWGGQ